MQQRQPNRLMILALTAIALSLPARAAAQPLEVAATVGMIGDVASEVGGDCIRLTTIMGSGVDPHVYQASARDVRIFDQAQLILYSGNSLEGQLGEVLHSFARRKPTIAVAEAGIPAERLIETDDAYGVDPHTWMDVSLWAGTVEVIAEAVGDLEPECAQELRERAKRYLGELEALHEWIGQAIATIPQQSRILVTAHDAFAYFGRAYGIEVEGIQGISTESEAGVADIRRMTRLVAEREVPAVFIESTINPRTIKAVVDAAARMGHQVKLGAELYSDALGEKGTPEGSYIGMMVSNTRSIVSALGGDVPPLPAGLDDWAAGWEPVEEAQER